MDTNETSTVVDTEAEQTTSPVVTDGASSSDAVVDAPESVSDAIRAEFLEKYGEADPEETEEADVEDEAGDAAGADADPEDADKATDTQDPEEEPLAADTDDGEDDKFRIPDEQFKALPDGVKKRLGHLNTRAKKAERELTTMREQIVPLEEASNRFTELQTFVQSNDIQPENVTLAFNAMARMSAGDYQGFLELVQPWFQHAQHAVGAAISPDLQQRVDDGYLTEEDAKEITKARVRADASEGRVKALTERSASEKQASKAEETRMSVIQAINTREAHFKSSDPDYALKSKAIASMIEFAIKNGNVPKTAQEAVEMVNDAHKSVTDSFAPARAAPKATPPRPSSSKPSLARPAPASAQEAMFRGMPSG